MFADPLITNFIIFCVFSVRLKVAVLKAFKLWRLSLHDLSFEIKVKSFDNSFYIAWQRQITKCDNVIWS